MLVEISADIDGGGLDGLEEHFGDARLFDVDEVRLEHAFGGEETFGANFDCAAVGELRGDRLEEMSMEGRGGLGDGGEGLRCTIRRVWWFLLIDVRRGRGRSCAVELAICLEQERESRSKDGLNEASEGATSRSWLGAAPQKHALTEVLCQYSKVYGKNGKQLHRWCGRGRK